MTRWLAALTVLLAACEGSEATGPEAQSCEQERVAFIPPVARLDLLIVVDATASAADLRAAPSDVAAALADADVELHLAVITSELGAAVPGCDAQRTTARSPDPARCGVEGAFLRHGPSPADRNYAGDLEATIACLIDVPASACPVSQPLAAALAAVDGSTPALAEFRRFDRAWLGVSILTDGDDCSLARPDALALPPGLAGAELEAAVDFACFAQGATCTPADPAAPGDHTACEHRPGGGLIDPIATEVILAGHGGAREALLGMVAGAPAARVIAGPRLAPTCGPADVEGSPAPRLHALARRRSAESRGRPLVECGADIALGALAPVLGAFHTTLGVACMVPSVDRQPEVPGVQASCAAVSLLPAADGEPSAELDLIAACSDPSRDPALPCYRFDPSYLPESDECMALFIEPGDQLTPARTVSVRCEIACDQGTGSTHPTH